jgi:hypothetical protein
MASTRESRPQSAITSASAPRYPAPAGVADFPEKIPQEIAEPMESPSEKQTRRLMVRENKTSPSFVQRLS